MGSTAEKNMRLATESKLRRGIGRSNLPAVETSRSLRRRNPSDGAKIPTGSPPSHGAAKSGTPQRLATVAELTSTASCPSATGRYSAKRTRHQVDFFCNAPKAQSVRLVGEFNGWDMAATPMRRMLDGRWFAGLEIHHGHHRYVFLVDGEPQLDPKATGVTRADHNNRLSLIDVSYHEGSHQEER